MLMLIDVFRFIEILCLKIFVYYFICVNFMMNRVIVYLEVGLYFDMCCLFFLSYFVDYLILFIFSLIEVVCFEFVLFFL